MRSGEGKLRTSILAPVSVVSAGKAAGGGGVYLTSYLRHICPVRQRRVGQAALSRARLVLRRGEGGVGGRTGGWSGADRRAHVLARRSVVLTFHVTVPCGVCFAVCLYRWRSPTPHEGVSVGDGSGGASHYAIEVAHG